MFLKSVTILRCSEPVVSPVIQTTKEMKDLEERINHLRNEKLVSEEAKQKLAFDLDALKKAIRLKDQRLEDKDHHLEESVTRLFKLEKANVVLDLKASICS